MINDYKPIIDLGAVGSIVATFLGWLPEIAAGLACVWYLIRFWEYWKTKKLS